MTKIDVKKKNFVEIDKNGNCESEDEFYDSMIENGTSDEEDSIEAESKELETNSIENKSEDEPSDKECNTSNMSEDVKSSSKAKRKNDEVNPTATKRIKNNTTSDNLYRPPTVEEINKLRETETHFHSNLFRMQIYETLRELKVKEKIKTFVNDWLSKFNLFLQELELQNEKIDSKNFVNMNTKRFMAPFQRNNNRQRCQFQFLKPSQPAILVGSVISDTITNEVLLIDVCVEMPAKTFQKGDYLNLIYEEKRALYMLHLVHKMVESKKYDAESIYFNYFQNNQIKPILEVNVDGKYKNKVMFRIFPVPEENSFKLNRFVPWNSNIRSTLFNEIGTKDEIFYATPYYNSNVLFDMTMKKNNELIQTIIGNNKNLQEGLILLKIWLKQRNLNEGSCAFNNHIITLFVVWLFRQRKLHVGMSNYQIVRNVWHQLASSSWNEEGQGLTLCTTKIEDSNQPNIEQMHQYFEVVFIDNSGFLNICANMSLDIYLRIKYESKRAIELLNDNKINSFQQLFMVQIPLYIQFDHIFGFEHCEIRKFLESAEQKSDRLNFAGCWEPHTIKHVTKILRKGLNDRVLSITPFETLVERWNISSKPPKLKKIIKMGLVLNLEKALELLDKGPQANESAASEFRNFWGEKSELRRFQDGSITEACVWGGANDTLKDKRLIVKKIIIHLLKLHFHINNISYVADELDNAYEVDDKLSTPNHPKSNSEYCTINVIKNFDDIGKKLRALQDLPLDVASIQGISPAFRYSDPIPILNNATYYTDLCTKKLLFRAFNVNEGIIELGVSGKWPNDLSALRRLKTAFHIQMANTLNKVYKMKTRGGIDGIYILNEGYMYKIEISHPKEIALLKKTITPKGVIHYTDNAESIQLEKRFNILPKVTSALHGLYQQFSSYGPAVMIAKRWLNSQLIDSYHWPDECTELLIAFQFLKHETLPNPCQPQTGFLRFLHLLANMNWRTDMFFLNFNDDTSQEEIDKLEEKFIKERETFPPLLIATSFDENKYGMWWSKTAPNMHILSRVITLARHSLEILKPMYLSNKKALVNNLFIPSLDGYDVIIKLNKNVIPACTAHNFLEINENSNIKVIPTAGFNPILLGLSELREGYSDFALFFYNPHGGREIAVKWKPNIFEPKEFELAQINACSPCENNKMVCKPKKFITDFKIILKGLFEEIIIS